jgi:hypothetical protein
MDTKLFTQVETTSVCPFVFGHALKMIGNEFSLLARAEGRITHQIHFKTAVNHDTLSECCITGSNQIRRHQHEIITCYFNLGTDNRFK